MGTVTMEFCTPMEGQRPRGYHDNPLVAMPPAPSFADLLRKMVGIYLMYDPVLIRSKLVIIWDNLLNTGV